MNDDFIYKHRPIPDDQFGAALYQQLLDADETQASIVLPAKPKHSHLWLRIAAAIVLIFAVEAIALQSKNHSTPPNLVQIDTHLLLDDLPPITTTNAAQILQVAQMGKGYADSIAYSPDGSTLAVSTSNGIVLYDADLQNIPHLLRTPVMVSTSDGNPIYSVDLQTDTRLLRTAHVSYKRPVAFSADGKEVATVDGDAIRIWDVTSGAQNALFTVEANSDLTTLQFSPDGRWLAAGGGKNISFSLYVWNLATQKLLGTRSLKQASPVVALAFSPDGNVLAVQSAAGVTDLYDPSLTQRNSIETTTNNVVSGIAFSPDGKELAVAHQDSIYCWDVQTRDLIQTIPLVVGDSASIVNLTYSPNGLLLAIADLNHGIMVWDTRAGKFLRPPQNMYGWWEISNVAFSADSRRLAVIHFGKTVSVEDARTGTEIAHRTAYDGSALDLTLNPDNVTVATYYFDGSISFYNLKTGELIKTLNPGLNFINHISFSPDGQRIAVSGFNPSPDATINVTVDEGIKLFDWKTGAKLAVFGRMDQLLYAFTFTQDGRLFAYDPNGSQPRVIWWNINQPDQEQVFLSGKLLQAQDIQLSRDGSILASYGYGVKGQTHVFNTSTGEELSISGLSQYAPDRMALSPDGSALALLTGDIGAGRALTVFDLRSNTELYQHPFAPDDLIYSIAFSPDSHLIAAGGQNRFMIFDMSSDKVIYRNQDELGQINKLTFSSDSRYIVTSGWDGYIRVWGVPPPDKP